MVRLLRRLAWGLLGLVAAALLLALVLLLAWALTQGPDAAPRPLPPALQLAFAPAPGPVFERLQQWPQGDAAAAAERLARPPLGCAPGEDCAPRWARETTAIARALAEAPALGARCEALQALVQAGQVYAEWLPPRLEPSTPLPSYSGLMHCQRWWVGQALVAAGRGDEALARAQLQTSHDWALGALAGARSLIGTLIAQAQLHLHLKAVAATALLQPGWAAGLEPLVQPWRTGLLQPGRWMPVEAAMGRGAVDAADAACHGDAAPAQPPAMDGLARWLCRYQLGWLPETTRQRLDAAWLARLERAQAGPEAWLEAALARRAAAEPADEPWAALAWRNTMGEMLLAMAADDHLYDGYVARAADLELHRRLLAATLALRREGVPPAAREAAWAAAAEPPPALKARSTWEPGGRALRWRSWSADLAPSGAAGAAAVPSRIALDRDP